MRVGFIGLAATAIVPLTPRRSPSSPQFRERQHPGAIPLRSD
jgi:hypothetical protein